MFVCEWTIMQKVVREGNNPFVGYAMEELTNYLYGFTDSVKIPARKGCDEVRIVHASHKIDNF